MSLTQHLKSAPNRRARDETTQIVDDVQLLSHEFHSSKLEYLGIVEAAKNFFK